ncbi:MAG TPA: addiction module protein [Thermoanaerobaculia bacterium]|nr:addiction module protein [Thermoanaerobaculia bacterium]
MTDATNRVLQQALALEPDERATLAAELLASLEASESEDDVQRAWAAEIERRSRDAAEERGEEWRVVLDEIRAGERQR